MVVVEQVVEEVGVVLVVVVPVSFVVAFGVVIGDSVLGSASISCLPLVENSKGEPVDRGEECLGEEEGGTGNLLTFVFTFREPDGLNIIAPTGLGLLTRQDLGDGSLFLVGGEPSELHNPRINGASLWSLSTFFSGSVSRLSMHKELLFPVRLSFGASDFPLLTKISEVSLLSMPT